jgi:hypothetical protein
MRLGKALESEFGLDLSKTPVATSPMWRSVQTAEAAGFSVVNTHLELAEVAFANKIPKEGEIFTGQPVEVIAAAEKLVENPLSEQVWITNSRLLAALCQAVEVEYSINNLTPRRCVPIELPIG